MNFTHTFSHGLESSKFDVMKLIIKSVIDSVTIPPENITVMQYDAETEEQLQVVDSSYRKLYESSCAGGDTDK